MTSNAEGPFNLPGTSFTVAVTVVRKFLDVNTCNVVLVCNEVATVAPLDGLRSALTKLHPIVGAMSCRSGPALRQGHHLSRQFLPE